jgi:hypothetical protein
MHNSIQSGWRRIVNHVFLGKVVNYPQGSGKERGVSDILYIS